ncbi:MAG TPA: shikimate kinase [Longimicrobiales bacterium]|nr:shikimate kinase [Longimicrobiales bacterium]
MSDATQVVLVGLSGSGKSTVGKILAQLLGWRFVDLDQLIEAKTTLTVAEIFAQHGEDRFRQWEADLTKRLASQHQVVIAPGAGWITNPALPKLLPPGAVAVWLRVTPEQAWARIRATGVKRPLLEVPEALERLQSLLAERRALYEQAHAAFDTDDLDPRVVAELIYQWLIKQKKSALSS